MLLSISTYPKKKLCNSDNVIQFFTNWTPKINLANTHVPVKLLKNEKGFEL